jgi:hypothetical protein
VPHICDMGQTASLPLRGKASCGIFSPEKSDGFGRVGSREHDNHPPIVTSLCLCSVLHLWPIHQGQLPTGSQSSRRLSGRPQKSSSIRIAGGQTDTSQLNGTSPGAFRRIRLNIRITSETQSNTEPETPAAISTTHTGIHDSS